MLAGVKVFWLLILLCFRGAVRFKVTNICFLAAFLIIIGGTVALKGFSTLGVEFPNWTGIGLERSYLEGRKYQDEPRLSIDELLSAEFQDDFDQYVADSIPMRDDVLLLNAAVQQACIRLAALPLGYEVYPTFFDSEYVYDSARDLLATVMSTATNEKIKEYEYAAEVYRAFAERHDELNVYVYRVYRLDASSKNPAYDLIANPVDEDFRTNHFFNALGDDITVIDGPFASYEELVNSYFATDHHWTIEGAYKAYLEVTEALERPALSSDNCVEVVFEDVPFWGSLARSGLCLTNSPDVISDYWFEASRVRVLINGEAASLDDVDHYRAYLEGDYSKNDFANHYGGYFHSDYGIIEFYNEEAPEGTLLLVGDSFTNNIERFFSQSYQSVIVVDARHCDLALDEVIDQYGADDVLFLFGTLNPGEDQLLWAM